MEFRDCRFSEAWVGWYSLSKCGFLAESVHWVAFRSMFVGMGQVLTGWLRNKELSLSDSLTKKHVHYVIDWCINTDWVKVFKPDLVICYQGYRALIYWLGRFKTDSCLVPWPQKSQSFHNNVETFKKSIYFWLHQVLVAVCGIFVVGPRVQ